MAKILIRHFFQLALLFSLIGCFGKEVGEGETGPVYEDNTDSAQEPGETEDPGENLYNYDDVDDQQQEQLPENETIGSAEESAVSEGEQSTQESEDSEESESSEETEQTQENEDAEQSQGGDSQESEQSDNSGGSAAITLTYNQRAQYVILYTNCKSCHGFFNSVDQEITKVESAFGDHNIDAELGEDAVVDGAIDAIVDLYDHLGAGKPFNRTGLDALGSNMSDKVGHNLTEKTNLDKLESWIKQEHGL